MRTNLPRIAYFEFKLHDQARYFLKCSSQTLWGKKMACKHLLLHHIEYIFHNLLIRPEEHR